MHRLTKIIWCLMTLLSLVVTDSQLLADEKPQVIQPEEAREYEGQLVSVTFKVKATKEAKHRKTVFLDSEEDFHDERNLGIALTEEAVAELRKEQGVLTPADHFRDKTIRVVGKIVIRDDRPYIDVKEADQLEEVKEQDAENAS